MYKTIMVTTDGSELSQKAVQAAVEIAKGLNAKLTGFYVMPEYPGTVYAEGARFNQYLNRGQFLDAQRQHADEVLGEVKRQAAKAGVQADTATAESNTPFEAIVAEAERQGCDMIVMASHARRGLTHVMLGSQTQQVLTHSKVPVLVVR